MTSSYFRKKLLYNLLKYKGFFPTVPVIVSVSYFYNFIRKLNYKENKKHIQ